MPRRLTGAEEAVLVEAAHRLKPVERERDQLLAERDHLIAKTLEAGARATDIAAVLGISRNAVYAAYRRATR